MRACVRACLPVLLRRGSPAAHAVVLGHAAVCAAGVRLAAEGVVLAEPAGGVFAEFLVAAAAGAACACAGADGVVVA